MKSQNIGLSRTVSDPTQADTASARLAGGIIVLLTALAGCSSVPGETTVSHGVQREVRERVLSQARQADPGCKQPKVSTTEMLDVRSDGQSAQELWIVEACGRRLNYVVTFPPRKSGSASAFSVRPER